MKKQGADVIGAKAGAKPKKPYIQKDTIGSTQNAEIVYGIGDGENGGLINGLNSIILDGTRVIGSSGEVNFNEVKYEERFGLIDQPPLKLIEDTITERGLNLEVRSAAPVVSSFNNKDVDKFVVRISVPSLMQNKDNGDSVAATISYAIDISVDGGAYQTVLEASATEKITNGYEFDHEIDAPVGTQRTIRVRRTTPDSTSQLLIDKFYVAAISEVINAKFSHPTLHYIGLVFNAEQFNNIPKAVFHYYGRKIKVPVNYNPTTRQYDGIWNGTFKVVYSNNPAWVLFDILTDRRSGLGRRIPVELVDKWELYRIAQYCDELVPDGEGGMEPRFVCNNLVLNSKQDAYQVLKDIASIFRGQSFWNGSQVVTVADAPRDIDYAISMASVISYSYSGTARNARHNVVKVQYYDKNKENSAAYEYATDYDSIRETEQINEVEIRAFGCTSAGQAQRLARYTLLSEQTETRILTAKLSMDAFVNMQIGDVFAWSDKFLAGANNGGRVVAVNGTELTLDRDVTDSALVGDTLFVNTTSGKASTRTITAIKGNKVTLDAVMSTTEPEFVWVIDSAELSLLYFKLDDYKVNPAEGTVDIVGIQHVNSKFNTIDSETALEAPPFSKVEIETLRAPGNVITSFNVRVDQGLNIADLYVSWGQVKGATRYTVEFRRDSQAWRVLGNVTGLTHTIENVSAGIYEVRVRAADSIGNLSPYGFSAPINVAGIVLPPPKLASFTAVGKLLAIATKWTFPAGTEASLAVVIEHTTQDPKNVGVPTQKLNIPYPQTEYVFNGLGANTKMWFRAAIVDKYNQEGAFTAWTTATADANPEELIDVISGHISEGTLDQTLKGKIDGAGALAGEAQDLANQAKTAAANAQTTANNAGTAAADAAGKATNAANAVAKEVTDRVAAVTAETNARTAALTKEATDRAAAIAAEAKARTDGLAKEATDRATAISKEATDRAAALTAQANTLKADSAAKVKALKDEVDPKLVTLQDGITKVTTDYKAGDTAVVGQLNAYKTSNDNAVASVLQKAESAVSTGATNSSAITAINGQISTINGALSNKLDASVITGYYTKGQADAKAAEIAAGKVEEFNATLRELPTQGENLIPNGTFDTNLPSYGFTSIPSDSEGVPEGCPFPYVTRLANRDHFLDTRKAANIPCKAGDVYEISVLVACAIGTAQFNLYTYRRNSATTTSNLVAARVGGVTAAEGTTWKRLTVRWTVPAHATHQFFVPFLQIDQSSPFGTVWYATDWSCVNVSAGAKAQSIADATASSLTATNAEVARVDGRVTATNSNVTTLTGRVSAVEGAVSTKAEAAALNSLTTRVGTVEGGVSSQGTAITNLQNTINHTTTGLASKASTAALSSLDSKVTAIDGTVAGHTSQLTNLSGSIAAINGTLAGKVDSTALVNYYTKQQANDAMASAATGAVQEYDASLVIGGVNLLKTAELTSGDNVARHYSTHAFVDDLACPSGNTNVVKVTTSGGTGGIYVNPGDTSNNNKGEIFTASVWLKGENGGERVYITEGHTAIPAGSNSFVLTTTWKRYSCQLRRTNDTTFNFVIYCTSGAGSVFYASRVQYEKGTKMSAWAHPQQALKDAVTTNSTAIQNTNAEVSRVDGRVTAANNATTALAGRVSTVEGAVSTKAEASAVSALTTRVTNAEGELKAQSSQVTNLEASLSNLQIGGTNLLAKSKMTNGSVDGGTGADGTNNSHLRFKTAEPLSSKRTVVFSASASGLTFKVYPFVGTSYKGSIILAPNVPYTFNADVTSFKVEINGAAGNVENISNYKIQLEYGTIATDWSPAPEDIATTAALASLDSKVTSIDGKVTANSASITNLSGKVTAVENGLATKADASALNSLTTRVGNTEGALSTQSNSITSLQNSLSSLSVGGTNLKRNSDFATGDHSGWSTNGGAVSVLSGDSKFNTFAKISGTGNNGFYFSPIKGWEVNTTYTASFYIRNATKKLSVSIEDGNAWVVKSDYIAGSTEWERVVVTFNKTSTRGAFVIYLNAGSATHSYEITRAKLEKGSVVSEWSPAPEDIDQQLSANATAISTLDNKVTQQGNSISSQSGQIANLQNSITTINGTLSNKADSSALSALTTRVATEEGKSTSQGAAITALENSVNHATTGLSTKASSAALTAVDNKVIAVDGRVTTTNSNVATLSGRVSTVEGAVATKADVSALNNIYTKTEADAKATSLAAGEISKYDASLVIGGTNLFSFAGAVAGYLNTASGVIVNSTASHQSMPTLIPLGSHKSMTYQVWNPSGITNSSNANRVAFFKADGSFLSNYTIPQLNGTTYQTTLIQIPAAATHARLGVIAGPAGGARDEAVKVKIEFGNKATDWSEADSAIVDSLNVNANAISTTNTEVSRINGVVSSQGQSITSLNNSVSTINGTLANKADTSALNALTNRVTTEEGKTAAQGTAITALENKVNHATTGLNSKVSQSSFDTLNNKVNASGTGLDAVNNKTTSLTTDVTLLKQSIDYVITTNRNGGNSAASRSAGLYTSDATRRVTVSRGFNLVVFAADGSVAASTSYDVYGSYAAQILALKNALNALAANVFFALIGCDNILNFGTANDADTVAVKNFLLNAGANSDFLTASVQNRIPVFVGRNGIGSNSGLMRLITSTTNQAWIDVPISIVGGKVVGVDGASGEQIANETKASASALQDLSTRVQVEEGKSTSQGTAITNLENAVNNATTGLASKASASALTTLNNQVQHSTTGLSAVNTKVDNLKATIENTTNGLASKASSSALDTLSNKVNHSTTGLDAVASKTTVLESDVSKALDAVTVSDTRATNQPPSWYLANYPRRVVNEFKTQTAIGVGGFFGGTYCNLETKVYYSDLSGGQLIQTATSSADPSLYVQRVSTSTSAWSAWAQPIKDLRDGLAGKASASAVESLTTRVGTAEGKIDTEAGKLLNLSTTVGGHTTTINSQTTSINGIRGVHALKIDTNGVISGYGLISELVNGQVKSQFGINADNFFIGAPSSNKKPFVVYTTPGVINGVTVPAGTYIDTAFIGAATIGTAHIRDLGVTTAKIGNGAITTAKIGDLQVDTLKIANNAVTVPVYSYVSGNTYMNSREWITSQSIWAPCSNGVTLFFFNFSYDCGRQDTKYEVMCRILKNGVIVKPEFSIFYFEADLNNANIRTRPAGTLSLNHADDTGVDGTFELQFYVLSGNGWNVANRYTSSLTVRK